MHWLQARASAVRYRVGGLPPSIRYFPRPRSTSPKQVLRHVEARRYWRIASATDAFDLLAAFLFLPLFVIGAAAWHTARSGRIHAARCGRHPLLQFADQIRIYLSSGVMPATYYIFSLVEHPTNARARTYLKRAETKGMIYPIVRQHMPPASSLNDKQAFEQRCTAAGLPIVPTVAVVRDGKLVGGPLPARDLFVKPVRGKGGRGAERWRWTGTGYRAAGAVLSRELLVDRLIERCRGGGLIIQPCLSNHETLSALNCGTLATIRVLTCLDELGEPEVIGAALRMAADPTSIVDNLHQGGITAAVDPSTGVLGPASDLGKDPRLGWLDRHPVTGAEIAGRCLDWWPEVHALALRAHRAFDDRLFVGWDLAMTHHGPVIVEGNSSPDLDILQRSSRLGMANGRFAELLAARLVAWGECAPLAA